MGDHRRRRARPDPDVYLRDFVGDSGEPHAGAISASPDIILRPAPVADPQAAFGAGSGTEHSATLGALAETGHDNVLYVRMLNQGGAPAADVWARVFWSEVATLVTPDLWRNIGSVVVPSVPTGDVPTVSGAITWPASDIPAPGHYCFVGLIGHGRDPAPEPADFLDWDNFRTFIRDNKNNVTWRNFNVVDSNPAPNSRDSGDSRDSGNGFPAFPDDRNPRQGPADGPRAGQPAARRIEHP